MTAIATFTDNKLQQLKTTEPYESPLKVNALINSMMRGRGNNVGTFTLDANAASTAVIDTLYESQQGVWLTALTANAAAELGAGTIYLSNRIGGQFTFTHANNIQTDRTYLYVRVG